MKATLTITYETDVDKDGRDYLKGVDKSRDWDAFKKVFKVDERDPDSFELSFEE